MTSKTLQINPFGLTEMISDVIEHFVAISKQFPISSHFFGCFLNNLSSAYLWLAVLSLTPNTVKLYFIHSCVWLCWYQQSHPSGSIKSRLWCHAYCRSLMQCISVCPFTSAGSWESHGPVPPAEGSHTVPVNQSHARKFNFHLQACSVSDIRFVKCGIVFPENEMNLASAVQFLVFGPNTGGRLGMKLANHFMIILWRFRVSL